MRENLKLIKYQAVIIYQDIFCFKVVVVVVNFISGLLNNINNKEKRTQRQNDIR